MGKKIDYNVIFIGAGPSTIMAVLELIHRRYSGKIGIIEKGKSLKNRQPNEVLEGFAGAGTYSDAKLTSALCVGGVIPWLTQDALDNYNARIMDYFNEFNDEELKWDCNSEYDTSGTFLEWDCHKTCHIGTDRGRVIYQNMEDFILMQPNIDIIYENEVIEVWDLEVKNKDEDIIHYFAISATDRNTNDVRHYTAYNVVVATGRGDKLPGKLMNRFNILKTPRNLQLGIRVVDTINSQYEDIIKANYDFKFFKRYTYANGVTIKVRTFCCNSGNAHVCAEKNGFVSFNGHAYKNPDPNNHSVNYGIICDINGLSEYKTREEQTGLVHKINNISTWKEDNFNGDIIEPKRKLLDGFDVLNGVYPSEVIQSLEDFVHELNKLIDLKNAHYLYPEIKLNDGYTPIVRDDWQTSMLGLYMIGDCNCTSGIIKSGISGLQFADAFYKV